MILTTFFVGCDASEENSIDHDVLVKTYYLECDADDFKQLYENFEDNTYIPVKISYLGDTAQAKMRIRGDTSREDPKKSLKIKFDSTGIAALPKKINLNAEYSDKTYIRQYLAALLMTKSGQICFQAEYAKVYLNGQFLGLYLQVENMDKGFLKRNGLDTKSNLYKATRDGACLSIFDDFDKKWEKKTNKNSDHNDLTELIQQINHTPDQEFESFVKKTFEYDQLVNVLAMNMMLSNNSTYYHNYYLYHDLYKTGKWQLLPWDMDKTLSYYSWMPYTYHRTSSEWESDNPLVERALLCEPIFNDIQNRITELHQSFLNDKTIQPLIDKLNLSLKEIVPLDTTDQIASEKEWESMLDLEKNYFDNQYELLQKQFKEQIHSFYVYRLDQIQTGPVTFRWQKAFHPSNKKITYVLSYGTDFLLTDSSKTTYVTAIADTFFSMEELLPEGIYYWKVSAFDGAYYTDGFNTKNRFEVKRGTPLPATISGVTVLRKEKSPYLVSQTTTVLKNASLTIEQGVEIHFAKEAAIACYGSFVAHGTAKEPVLLMPQNTAKEWGHLYFHKPSEKAYLKHVVFKEGVINCQGKSLILDSCSMFIDQKDMGMAEKRKVLIYADGTAVSILNSTFKSNGYGEGMVLFRSDATTENCYFDNTPDAIEYIGMNRGIIRNNYVSNAPDDAIDLNQCNNVLIEGNILFNNRDKAISIGTEQYGASLRNIQIKNNLIVGNHIAIAIKDSSVATMSNNTIFKNTKGVLAYKKREDYPVGGFGLVKNTIFEKNQETDVNPDQFSKLTVIHSIAGSRVLPGEKNMQGDPMFIDAAHHNFHLKQESVCIGQGDDGSDLGAFPSYSTTVGLARVHIKSAKEQNTGDYIELINHYNIPVNLSLYQLIITQNNETKTFVFPIGTTLERSGRLYVAENYFDFMALNKQATSIGGLPKLNSSATIIRLLNAQGDVLDEFSYSEISEKAEDLTFVSNGINDKRKKEWVLKAK
ncbi:MAG: CotH kinase family protein [Flavobacteriales bacterium]|nr:CotH kinase family protein [Flavobacteriales bacterium]